MTNNIEVAQMHSKECVSAPSFCGGDGVGKRRRLSVVDSLRGFALMAIVVLHSMEHYNIFCAINWQPDWLNGFDSVLTDWIWMLFAGKAYATFSLLFGFSFFVQMRNARARGCDFRLRFAWRMVMLALLAQLHALFYNGDILLFYSVCGLILIPASSWGNRTVVGVALVLLLQPVDWLHILLSNWLPGYEDLNARFAVYASQAEYVGMHGDFWQMIRDNIWNGQLYSNFWQVEAGRICQTPALFLLGMWLGRKEYFVRSAESERFWKRVFAVCVPLAAGMFFLKSYLCSLTLNATWISHIGIATGLPFNFLVMALWVSVFVLLWFHAGDGYAFQRLSISYGRMSLTNYICQSIIGVVLFYNFGLGLYRCCGATLSMLIGVGVIVVQTCFSCWWLKGHAQGPLEWVWKKLTWLHV